MRKEGRRGNTDFWWWGSEGEVGRRGVERVGEGRRQGPKQISVGGRLSLGCLGVETFLVFFVIPDPESILRLTVFSKLPALPLGY